MASSRSCDSPSRSPRAPPPSLPSLCRAHAKITILKNAINQERWVSPQAPLRPPQRPRHTPGPRHQQAHALGAAFGAFGAAGLVGPPPSKMSKMTIDALTSDNISPSLLHCSMLPLNRAPLKHRHTQVAGRAMDVVGQPQWYARGAINLSPPSRLTSSVEGFPGSRPCRTGLGRGQLGAFMGAPGLDGVGTAWQP